MNTQILEADLLRKKFIKLFADGMKRRIYDEGRILYFYFLFALLPLFIVMVVVLLSVNGVFIKNFLGVIFALYAFLYLYSLLSILGEDVNEMSQCLLEINFDHPEIAHALRITASLQWEDDTFSRVA